MPNSPHLEAVSEPAKHYNDLKYYFGNLNTLFSIRNTLAIDMMTAMPAGGMARRIKDISSITKRIYAETTTPAVTRLLEQVESESEAQPDEFSDWDKANIREMRRIYDHLAALPPDLYIASVQVSNEGRRKHKEALETQNWSDIQPYMEKVIDLYRRIADLKQKRFDTRTPYKSLLIGYASDISETQMDSLYEELLNPLKDIHNKAMQKQGSLPPPEKLEGRFSRGDQMWLNHTILELMGFDFNRGSLMVSALSPMCAGTPDDVRVLVRCETGDTFLDSLADTLYQGARALYLQNLPDAWKTQPVGQDQGALVMNALSILYETIIGRTPQFFDFVAVRAEGVFRQFKNSTFNPENLYRLKKVINNTTQRNEADELTKIFHDILRYRIEKDLISGDLAVKDLPERWNEESRSLIGLEPQSLADGCLQNPDWFTGRFGFIPSNTMSHLVAAEIHEKLYAEHTDMSQRVENGDLSAVGNWLKTNIHQKGRSMDSFALIQAATGQDRSAASLIKHLERRYLSDKR